MTRIETVVETLCKFFRECARMNPEYFEMIDTAVRDRYIKGDGTGCFSYPAPQCARRRLAEVGGDMMAVIKTLQGAPVGNLESFRLMERVFSEQFAVHDSEVHSGEKLSVKEPKDMPCDNVRNPSDPDSSYNNCHGRW